MEEETKQMDTVLPEHETLFPEDEGLVPAPPKQASEPSVNDPDLDRARMENEVYQRHFAAISALKAPCRVSFILPDELLTSLRPVEAGFIFGDELGNLVSRHIVNFTDMRDEYDFSNASKV